MSDDARPLSPEPQSAVAPPSRSQEQRRSRLEALRDRFLAVSLRSRTLRLVRTSKSGALDLTRLPGKSQAWLLKHLGSAIDAAAVDASTVLADVLAGASKAAPRAISPAAAVAAVSPAPAVAAPRASTEAGLSEDVATLWRASRDVFMETGADELAVGFPFFEGRTADGTWLRAPLFLFPAEIGQTRSGKLKWTLRPTGAPWLNTTLCETLRRLAGVRLAHEDFLAKDEDGLFKIDDATWQTFRDTLVGAGLAIDAPATLPSAPSPLEARADEARAAMPAGQFQLVFNLVLGRFPASGSTLVLDYEQLLEGTLDDASVGLAAPILAVDDEDEQGGSELALAPLEADDGHQGHLLGRLRRWQVVPSDKSQDDVFRFLEAPLTPDTRGLVVQGPPGTGKSQLITNLLASQIAEGQRVLLVCQKRAALDVVAERLERMGLREPVAVVHDVERDRNALYQAISDTLTVLLDETADGEVDPKKIIADVDKLATRAGKDLTARLAGSQSAWEALTDEDEQPHRPPLVALDEALFGHDASTQELPDLSAALDDIGLDEVPSAVRELESVAAQAAPLAPPHVFAERTDWATYGPKEIADLGQRFGTLAASLAQWAHNAAPEPGGLDAMVLDAQRETIAAAESLAKLANDEDLRRAHGLFCAWRSLPVKRNPDVSRSAAAAGNPEALAMLLRTERATLPPVPPELVALSPHEIDARIGKLDRLAALERKWWRIFLPSFWLLRGLPKKILAQVREPVRLGPSPALDLAQLHRDARRWQGLLVELPEHPIFHLAKLGDPASLDRPIALLETGIRVDDSAAELHVALSTYGAVWSDNKALAPYQSPSPLTLAVARELPRVVALAGLDRALLALGDFTPEWTMALRQLALANPPEAAAHIDALIAALPDAALCAELDRELAPLPGYVRTFARRYAGPTECASDSLRLALQAGWRTLKLAGRDPKALEKALLEPKLTAGVAAALDEARSVAARGAQARWRARLAAAGGDPNQRKELQKLLADVTKKRNRATLRQLQERHGSRATTSATGAMHAGPLELLRPIWFCSPESVASLFPLTPGLFDLVIFDEASQCPVESAVPALVRGTRAVIAGDDQQMPPSHFFQSGGDDDEIDAEESALLAAQSILGLARVALRTTTLSWHYRCRHEELIAFSNAAFYGRRLATAPNAERRTRLVSEGLHWQAVDGRWKDQTNAVEAERVVDLVGQILAESMANGQPPTLGIVAMNRPQADLIAQRIEARAASDEAFRATLQRDYDRAVIDQIFVRNLENVQGDERDIMILSLGYGPTEKSAKVQARFGPVGLQGGEKRLNVAITRARLGLWVVASCVPEDLAVDGTTHPGPKLLRAFLAFVRAVARGETSTAENLLDEAATLGQGKSSTRTTGVPRTGSKLRDALAKALEAEGHVVQKDLGLGRLSLDLAVRAADDDTFRVGLDTSGYLGRKDPLMRELYVPLFWQRVGWKLIRVTPGAWRRDPKAILEAIGKALK